MKILIADDDTISLRILERNLQKWGYEPVKANDGLEALSLLETDSSIRMTVLDWMMPGLDGIDVCRKIRSESKDMYTYIILLSAKTMKEDIIEGLDAGADDYITKPFDKYELEVRLRAGKRILELQGELIEARESMREIAMKDALTGVFNRGAILDQLEQEFQRSKRGNGDFGVALLDLDHFKRVNDTHGHVAGDQVLKVISMRLQSSIRAYDLVGRYGGEEFLLIMPGSKSTSLTQQAERLRIQVGEQPVYYKDVEIPVTCSIGVAAYHDAFESIEELVNIADKALYQAKENGRNQVVTAFSDSPKPTPEHNTVAD
jgi:two-component system, cell cycle response regulator